MANLTYIEKSNIESFLAMKDGYVMDFSNRTFQEFIVEAVGLDIEDDKYSYSSNSKANRLRQFIKVESDYIVGKLLSAFCAYWLSKVHIGEIDYINEENAYKECLAISEKLKQNDIGEHLDAIRPNSDERDFNILAQSIRESIENNMPEAALDRLHTFMFRYVRELCDRHLIPQNKSESLNAVFGKYIKYLNENKHLESVMSEKILKYSINIIEAFNDIRNNKSFAHDNPVLNHKESVLIFNNISNAIKFIESIEIEITNSKKLKVDDSSDLPF